ncbi:tRNA threonylcarbamoyladenosine dehydratase [Alcaligenaceae bacterium]|nr:tRNA threonylcarbamoyladenosine dehydratase [Alcaligenaceae bacterium]
MSDVLSIDSLRRFGGMERLYGADALSRLGGAHVIVAGIGGVGSWCAEALARSGVGALSLIDLDHISESNINRQLHALTETIGQAKVVAMAQRLRGINPACRVGMIDDFVGPDNVQALFAADASLLIDCTDQAAAKIAMILESRRRKLPIVVCGGAGGKTNPLALRSGDLSLAVNDALLSKLRNTLRRQHGYPRASDQAGKPRKRIPRLNVRALWFDQPVVLPTQWQAASAEPGAGDALQGLSCAGYGSAVTVTASMGMAAADLAIQYLLTGRYP